MNKADRRELFKKVGIWTAFVEDRDKALVGAPPHQRKYTKQSYEKNIAPTWLEQAEELLESMEEQEMSQEDREEKEKQDVELEALLNSKVKSSFLKDVKWVYQNIGNKNVTPKSAPSAGAYMYLRRMQKSSDLQQSFYLQMVPKMIPKSILEKEGQEEDDDGSSQIAKLTEITQSLSCG